MGVIFVMLSKFTKKIICSFALGILVFGSFNNETPNATVRVTCTSGRLPIKAAPSESSTTVGNFYKGESFLTDTNYYNNGQTYFQYLAYSGNLRYVNYIQTNGTYSVKSL